MSDSDPSVAPAPTASNSPQRPFYVAHNIFGLPNGKVYKRADVLRGPDALAFEQYVAAGETDPNNATPVDIDPEA